MQHRERVLVYKRSKKLIWKGFNNSGFVNWFDMRGMRNRQLSVFRLTEYKLRELCCVLVQLLSCG